MKKLLSLFLVLMLMVSMAGCGSSNEEEETAAAEEEVASGVEDGVLTIAMECGYAPYNWTQTDDSNGAVPISMCRALMPTATT